MVSEKNKTMNETVKNVLYRFKLWDKQDRDARLHLVLYCFIVILIGLNVLMWYGWKSAPDKIEVHHIPYLSSVVTERVGDTNPSHIYAFTFYIWQILNHWPDYGVRDYRKVLTNFRQFLTPRMQSQLHRDYERRLQSNELSRTRSIQGLSGAAYEGFNVKQLDNDVWEVILDVRVTEWSGDVEIKDVNFRYPLRIVKYDVNREFNPFGLALDGFTQEPYRIDN